MRHQYRYTFNLSRADERHDGLLTVLYHAGGHAALVQVTDYLRNRYHQERFVGNLERHGLAVRRTIAPPKNRGTYVALTSMGINRIADHFDTKPIAYASKPSHQRLATSFARFNYYARHRTFAQPLSDAIPPIASRAATVQQKNITEIARRLVERYTALAKLPAAPEVVAERAQIHAKHSALNAQWPTEQGIALVLRHHLNIRSLYIDLDHANLAEVCYVYVDQGNRPSRYQKLMCKLSRSAVSLSMTARLRILVDSPLRRSQFGAISNQAARLNEKAPEMDRYLSDRIILEPINLGFARYFAHTTELPDLFSEAEAEIVDSVLERRS